jgi:CheY-like chemotaxis protein
MKILVVDDDGTIAANAIVFLSFWGHEVEVVHDGLTALRRARAWLPGVIIARIALQGMDGFALTAAVQSDPRLRAAGIVLAGLPHDLAARRKAALLEVRAYLSIPLNVAELQRVISSISSSGMRSAPRSRRRGVA